MITPKRQIKFLERSEVRKIIDKIPDDGRGRRDRALLETLFSTGLRISEALALKVQQLKENTGTQELTIIGKGGWQRVIYISPVAMKAIRNYLSKRPENSEKLFLIGVRGSQMMVIKRAKAAGIEKHCTPHIFRHSLATHLLRRGANLRIVQDILGHRSISSTEIYTHCTNKDLKEAHQKYMA